jgi:hypothetical protein
MIAKRHFLEWEKVHGNLYGTPRAEILAILQTGKDIILDIDVKGAINISGQCAAARLIFIEPPSVEELICRLSLRGEKEIETRMKRVEDEIARKGEFGYLSSTTILKRHTEVPESDRRYKAERIWQEYVEVCMERLEIRFVLVHLAARGSKAAHQWGSSLRSRRTGVVTLSEIAEKHIYFEKKESIETNETPTSGRHSHVKKPFRVQKFKGSRERRNSDGCQHDH